MKNNLKQCLTEIAAAMEKYGVIIEHTGWKACVGFYDSATEEGIYFDEGSEITAADINGKINLPTIIE